ncbi:hypothetical protein O181_107230 [Austropuccinia psidii MF-1]|uniref:Uncharacterized protein n=1 Tax=Austropuccinia psidii MF-1 TaxID=1389203 RepID=A0A9Q3PNE4_9BASI|nr:hypothetical protein [Austropuccinia psidii MF-1]
MNQEFQAAVSAAIIEQNEQIIQTLQVEQHTPATASSSRKTPKKVKEKAKSTTLTRSFQTPTKPPKSSSKSKGHRKMRTPNIQNPKANQKKPMSKRSPHQLLLLETPEGSLKTKEAFFNHIKILWGLTDDKAIPQTPDPALLQEFYHRFSHNAELETVASNTSAASLINPQEIITLKGVHIGRKKIGHEIIDISEFFIQYTNAMLARLGIRIWCPDLNDAPDSLYNEACRISAIMTFRQIASGGAYEYMSINLAYCNDLVLLQKAYNHFVHFSMLQKYMKEEKEEGKNLRYKIIKGKVQRRRQRLCVFRQNYALTHSLPKRYLKVINDINAHIDDEFHPVNEVYVVKMLPFRSANANALFQRLGKLISQRKSLSGKSTPKYKRRRPKVPQISEFKTSPRELPISFYNAKWFNQLPPVERFSAADTSKVAFIPENQAPTNGTPHPDERLRDSEFTKKYWETLTTEYDLSHQIEDSDSSSDEEDESIDLSFGNDESIDEEEMENDEESTDDPLFEGESDPYEDNDNSMQTSFLAERPSTSDANPWL